MASSARVRPTADLARAREDIPGLIERLRSENPKGCEWVEDVFSEVLSQLRRSRVKDPAMVGLLYQSIAYHLGQRDEPSY